MAKTKIPKKGKSLAIGGVDGETFVTISGPLPNKSFIAFLQQYDHEGSDVSLGLNGKNYYGYDAYKKLGYDPERDAIPVEALGSTRGAEAAREVLADRQRRYGDFRTNLAATGRMFRAVLETYYGISLDHDVPAHVVALLNTCMKVQRASGGYHSDNLSDAINYMGAADEFHPGKPVAPSAPMCSACKESQATMRGDKNELLCKDCWQDQPPELQPKCRKKKPKVQRSKARRIVDGIKASQKKLIRSIEKNRRSRK